MNSIILMDCHHVFSIINRLCYFFKHLQCRHNCSTLSYLHKTGIAKALAMNPATPKIGCITTSSLKNRYIWKAKEIYLFTFAHFPQWTMNKLNYGNSYNATSGRFKIKKWQ